MTDLTHYQIDTKVVMCTIGLPLSGKSHLCKLIEDNIKCTRISTGDIARRLMSSPEEAKETAANDLFPRQQELYDNLLVELHAAPNGLILLDGFPRSEEQVEWMSNNMSQYFPFVIEAYVGDDSTLMARALKRHRDENDASPIDLQSRLAAAKRNNGLVHRKLSLKMYDTYTIFTSGDKSATLKQLDTIFAKRFQ